MNFKLNYEICDGVEKLEKEIARVRKAQQQFATFTQEQVDKIFFACSVAANKARIPLARLAVEETGMGVVEDKVIMITLSSTTPIPVSSTASLARGILALFAATEQAKKILSTCSCVNVANCC